MTTLASYFVSLLVIPFPFQDFLHPRARVSVFQKEILPYYVPSSNLIMASILE